MREGVGASQTLMIIIIFIVIVFGLLGATVNYYKAFKVNSYILASIEKYEGYNVTAKEEIASRLDAFGYFQNTNFSCPESRNGDPLVGVGNENTKQDDKYFYCVYYYSNDSSKSNQEKNYSGENMYYNYSVVSYISVDLPIAGVFNIPVHTKGERIYQFSSGGKS